MDFTNEFRVNLSPDEAWDLLTDVERIAPCMPGAQLTGVDGDAYNGVVKVKVGPMTVQYKGVVSFEEKDEAGRTAVLHARGRDTRGQGNVDARVTARLVPDADADGDGDGNGTRVTVDTRLTITGRIAQFGKGMIEEISGRLLAQFVDNLEGQLAAERRQGREQVREEVREEERAREPLTPTPTPIPTPTPTSAVKATAGSDTGPDSGSDAGSAVVPDADSGTGPGPGPGAAAPTTATPGLTAENASAAGATRETAPTAPVTQALSVASSAPASNGARPAPPSASAAAQPLDLMSIARGAVLKRALPAALVLAVIVVVLVVWLTR